MYPVSTSLMYYYNAHILHLHSTGTACNMLIHVHGILVAELKLLLLLNNIIVYHYLTFNETMIINLYRYRMFILTTCSV